MLKYLLDTNIVIYVIKHRPIEVLATFNQHVGQMCISSITVAELLHGVEKSAQPIHNLRQPVGRFCDNKPPCQTKLNAVKGWIANETVKVLPTITINSGKYVVSH